MMKKKKEKTSLSLSFSIERPAVGVPVVPSHRGEGPAQRPRLRVPDCDFELELGSCEAGSRPPDSASQACSLPQEPWPAPLVLAGGAKPLREAWTPCELLAGHRRGGPGAPTLGAGCPHWGHCRLLLGQMQPGKRISREKLALGT